VESRKTCGGHRMSAKKRFTVKGCIGKIFYSPKEWEVDRETAFYYRIVNRNTGKKNG
jgi:hypothetical protein